MVLEAILEPMGFKVDLRDDGAAALEAWRSTAYDLILMDVQMPVLDGVAATARIRAEEAASGRRRTPIIALTANAMTHQLAEYRDAGMDDCVAKPIRIPDLLAAIDRVTAGEASIEATEAA
jgi:CheY-like chemotaxis protein